MIPLLTILKGIKREAKQTIFPQVNCPQCEKHVMKKELLKNGCYVCGYHEK